MNRKTKTILSILGIAAITIPAALLIFVTSRGNSVPEISTEKRPIDTKNVSDTSQKSLPGESPTPLPSPSLPAATSSASPLSSPNGQ